MARKPRIHCPGALYQVIARGNQQQTIFLHQEDYTTYLLYLSAYKAKFQFRLYAYALMHNDTVLKKNIRSFGKTAYQGKKDVISYYDCLTPLFPLFASRISESMG